MCCAACPFPSLYRWPGAVLVDLGGVESSWDSYSQRETFPPGSLSPRRTPPQVGRPHHQISASPLGVPCPPSLRVVGRIWYCLETCGTFQKLPEPSRTHRDHSRPFRDLLGWFRDIPEPSGTLPRPSGTVFGRSGTIWIGSGMIRVTV